MDTMEKQQGAAAAALARVSARDRFESHGLPGETVARIRDYLADVQGLKHAWLARKSVPDTHRRLYVLRVARAGLLPSFHADIALARRAATVLSLPGRVFVCTSAANGIRLALKVKRAGAKIV
jgi:predicted short-subunit dehydrogenase-like oxidoreductase (DUF2520 family)